MIRYLLLLNLFVCHAIAYATLAGGRPNAFSGGQNAFAGVVNPANAVWIADRCDLGAYWVNQKSSVNNHDNNPRFLLGKMDLTYRSKNLLTVDAAIHKHVKLRMGSQDHDSSYSLAIYTLPSFLKLRTKKPIPIAGTTPMKLLDKTNVISMVFSFKLSNFQSVGISIDYFHFSHCRNGYQNTDNPQRSVSPGHVTNNGFDHSGGIGISIGWRWNITEKLNFGAAWSRKSYCGRYRKYRGYEPYHAQNYTPQTVGAGFSYRFTSKLLGRLEVLWSNLGNMPNSNNNVLPNGSLNLNKRGSSKSPGSGLNDATYINIGLGYQLNSMLSVGAGFSHRLKFPRKTSNFLSHSYARQTIYDVLTFGANFKHHKHDLFLSIAYGFKNTVSGLMPLELGGGRFTGEKQNISISISWGYMY